MNGKRDITASPIQNNSEQEPVVEVDSKKKSKISPSTIANINNVILVEKGRGVYFHYLDIMDIWDILESNLLYVYFYADSDDGALYIDRYVSSAILALSLVYSVFLLG